MKGREENDNQNILHNLRLNVLKCLSNVKQRLIIDKLVLKREVSFAEFQC